MYEHPEALSSILIAASSCYIQPSVRHSVIKILHGLFLQSDTIKETFVRHNIIELLANLLVTEFEHNAVYYKYVFRHYAFFHFKILTYYCIQVCMVSFQNLS